MLLEIPWFLRLVVIKSNLQHLKRPCKELDKPPSDRGNNFHQTGQEMTSSQFLNSNKTKQLPKSIRFPFVDPIFPLEGGIPRERFEKMLEQHCKRVAWDGNLTLSRGREWLLKAMSHPDW